MGVRDKINYGHDKNFFQLYTAQYTGYNDECDVLVNIRNAKNFSLVNYGSVTVTYSFNGFTDHGDLRPGTPTAAIFFDNRAVTKIWFKVASGTAEVRVEAWTSPS